MVFSIFISSVYFSILLSFLISWTTNTKRGVWKNAYFWIYMINFLWQSLTYYTCTPCMPWSVHLKLAFLFQILVTYFNNIFRIYVGKSYWTVHLISFPSPFAIYSPFVMPSYTCASLSWRLTSKKWNILKIFFVHISRSKA